MARWRPSRRGRPHHPSHGERGPRRDRPLRQLDPLTTRLVAEQVRLLLAEPLHPVAHHRPQDVVELAPLPDRNVRGQPLLTCSLRAPSSSAADRSSSPPRLSASRRLRPISGCNSRRATFGACPLLVPRLTSQKSRAQPPKSNRTIRQPRECFPAGTRRQYYQQLDVRRLSNVPLTPSRCRMARWRSSRQRRLREGSPPDGRQLRYALDRVTRLAHFQLACDRSCSSIAPRQHSTIHPSLHFLDIYLLTLITR